MWGYRGMLEIVDNFIVIFQFLNKTLKEFVYSWYNNLSADESFVLELRQSIRYAACVLLRRGLQVSLKIYMCTEILIISVCYWKPFTELFHLLVYNLMLPQLHSLYSTD